jgi:hypothetical protein
MKADIDLRKVLFQQIVLAGGSTLFQGTHLACMHHACREAFPV